MRYFLILFSHTLRIQPSDNVESVKPITGTKEDRNTLDSGYVHQMMNDGKLAWILTDGRDYYEDDDVIFDVESSMDARYRKDLMKNVRRGMISKAEKGWYPAVPPTGYINDRINRTIVKDPATFDLVRKVFDK